MDGLARASRSRWFSDMFLTSSRHATLDLRAERPNLVCDTPKCYTFVWRGPQIKYLRPASGQTRAVASLCPGDILFVGSSLFRVEGFVAPKSEPLRVRYIDVDDRSDLEGDTLHEGNQIIEPRQPGNVEP